MHFLSSPQFLALRVSQEECEEVFTKAKSLLLEVTHPVYRSNVESIALPEPRGARRGARSGRPRRSSQPA